jgi:Zn-dependent peptidase ImmA (M78 family)/transcriptional regulator with XRE-family HTH domain
MNEAIQERFQRMVGQRIRIARRELGLTQEEVSAQLGFTARQTLSYIEDGQRKVTAEELVKFMQVLKKQLDFFTDPFLLIGEATVSWRANKEPKALAGFEKKMLPVVAAYRHLASDLRQMQTVLVPQLPLTPTSSFEEASAAGERLVKEWGLGKIPSQELSTASEKKLSLLVLMVDAPEGISGAAIHLAALDTIIINRNEPAGRRNYDFGHELFHVLTWHSMPPPHLDGENGKGSKQKRIEQLADLFTSSLLMPADTVKTLWEASKDREILPWIKETARMLGVSGKALLWRLVNLGCLSRTEAEAMNQKRLSPEAEVTKPKLYSQSFVECLHKGIDKGLISVRKVAALLDCDIEDLEDLFHEYGFEPPFDL